MKNFDLYVGIDWSGAKQIQTSAIQVAACKKGNSAPSLMLPPQGGNWSRKAVSNWIEATCESDVRTFIGIDCNFGYNADVLEKQLSATAIAHDLWIKVDAVCHDIPNYYAESFWLKYKKYFWLEGKQPSWFEGKELRRKTEWACGEQGLGWPESPFKLCYTKQVGKGGLAAMRMVNDLRKRCGQKIAVWPFDEVNKYDKAKIVISEIYPRQFLKRAGWGNNKVRNIDDLNDCLMKLESLKMTAESVSDHAADALVSAAGIRVLCGNGDDLPENITSPKSMDERSAQKEGWIFGVA